MGGLFYFTDLDISSQVNAVDTFLADTKKIISINIKKQKAESVKNITDAINDRHRIHRILRSIDVYNKMCDDYSYAVDVICANLTQFDIAGNHYSYILKHTDYAH